MRSERVLTLTGRMSARLVAAIDDLGALLPVGMALQFKGDFPGNVKEQKSWLLLIDLSCLYDII